MNKLIAGGLLAATSLSGGSAQAAELFATMGPILASAPDAATLTAQCDRYMAEIERRQVELESERGAATMARTLTRFDQLNALLSAGYSDFGLYQEVMADQARRDAGANCQVRLATLDSKISLSRPLYDRLKAIPASGADAPTKLYLTRTLEEFERSGVALDAGKRAQVQQLNEELAKLGTQFDDNVANGRKVVRAQLDELAGVPADFIAAHKPGPDGLIEISTDTPDYTPVMNYAESDALRRRLSEAYNQRAYPQNDAVLRQIFTKRQQLATLLGRPNYASLVLENKMVDSPAKVQQLLDDMSAAARPAADRDYAKMLRVLRELKPGAQQVEFWQNGWL
ncbi:MAG: M3 family metallopeptidase, partial [Croceibacterium sp.]